MIGTTAYHVVSTDGTRIAVWQSGSGPPFVAVHGTTADHTRWKRVADALEARFSLHVMDRRGRGQSGDADAYSLEQEGDDIATVVRHVGGQVTLFGHSYGALCCIEAALRLPELHRLILYEPPLPIGNGLVSEAMRVELGRLIERGDREAALTLFFRNVVRLPDSELELLKGDPAWPERVAAAHTIPRESNVESEYSPDMGRLARLDVPTLLLLGAESPVYFREGTARLHAAIPLSRVVELPGQKHIAMDTAPALFLHAVIAFAADEDDPQRSQSA